MGNETNRGRSKNFEAIYDNWVNTLRFFIKFDTPMCFSYKYRRKINNTTLFIVFIVICFDPKES
jgi:hypothetical protein